MIKTVCFGLTGLVFSLLSACASVQRPPVDPNASLYERLGGKAGITAVVEDMTRFVAEDERINGFFIGVDIANVNQQLYNQICEATGGDCVYTGRDMYSLHHGMNISEAQFNALVEDLIKSLNKHGVPQKEQDQLLGALGAMKKDIIDH